MTSYTICTKKCLTSFDRGTLSNAEKGCLHKCFGRQNEVFQMVTSKADDFIKKHGKSSLADSLSMKFD